MAASRVIMPQGNSGMLKLPAELRNKIYEEAFANNGPSSVWIHQAKSLAPKPSLLITCRQTYYEAKGMYEEATLAFWSGSVLKIRVSSSIERREFLYQYVSDAQIQQIKGVEVDMVVSGRRTTMRLTTDAEYPCPRFELDHSGVSTRRGQSRDLKRALSRRWRDCQERIFSEYNRHTLRLERCREYLEVANQQFDALGTDHRSALSNKQIKHMRKTLKQQISDIFDEIDEIAKPWKKRQLEAVLTACYDVI